MIKIDVTPLNPATAHVLILGLVTHNPAMYELLTRTDKRRDMCEISIRNPDFLNTPLKKLDFPEDLLVIAVRKDGKLIIPPGDTNLRFSDKLTALGSKDCLEISLSRFGPSA